MRNTGRWRFVDNESLGPPVDYHEVRGHLRIGTVAIVDPDLRRKVANGEPVTEVEDVAIRRAVFKAILYVSELSGLRDPSRLHYLFWNIFRAVCVRNAPRCSASGRPPLLPPRYQPQMDVDDDVHCPYETVCKSAHVANPIIEHVAVTDYY